MCVCVISNSHSTQEQSTHSLLDGTPLADDNLHQHACLVGNDLPLLESIRGHVSPTFLAIICVAIVVLESTYGLDFE